MSVLQRIIFNFNAGILYIIWTGTSIVVFLRNIAKLNPGGATVSATSNFLSYISTCYPIHLLITARNIPIFQLPASALRHHDLRCALGAARCDTTAACYEASILHMISRDTWTPRITRDVAIIPIISCLYFTGPPFDYKTLLVGAVIFHQYRSSTE